MTSIDTIMYLCNSNNVIKFRKIDIFIHNRIEKK